MPLPDTFTFSQSSLQDYADCPRRFQLRYILSVRWPAAADKPAMEWERQMRQGAAFHHLVHQHLVGLPAEILNAMVAEGDLHRWWTAYLSSPPANLPTNARYAEARLQTRLGRHRLAARYDLIAITPGQKAVIVDWKTEQTRPKRALLERRWQTRLYLYILTQAGTHLNSGMSVVPDQVEMIYWFANFPAQLERFEYNAEQHQATQSALAELIAEIMARREQVWPLVTDVKRCKFCVYRTLCGRLDGAGDETVESEELLGDDTDPFAFDLHLDQIAEIEF